MLILFHQEEGEGKKTTTKKGFLGKINLKNTMDEQ